jgi:hypothetical protein
MRLLILLGILPWTGFCQIKILSPASLEQNTALDSGIIYGTTAIFGAPEYGHRMLGELIYHRPSKSHCEEEDFAPYPNSDDPHETRIFVVDRGGCPFEKKVRLAQQRGAEAVIVVDFPCAKQKELAVSEGHPDTPCRDSEAIQRIIMADTSGAKDIEIPSILIAREEGELLISAITSYQVSLTGEIPNASDKAVVAMLLWDIPRSEFVSVDLWMSSAATDTGYFMSHFAPIAKELGEKLQFVPRYSLKEMSRVEVYRTSNCLASKSEETYFCDSRLSHFGKSAVLEDLRQLCIWHATAKASTTESGKIVTSSPLYWDYITEAYEACHPARVSDPAEYLTDSCSSKVMKKLGINEDAVNWCMENVKPPVCKSGFVQRPECSNSFNLLSDQAAHQAWSPHALRINGWRYSGPLEASVVLKTICQGFSSVPDVCHHIPTLGGSMYQGLSAGMAWFLGLSLLGLVVVAFLVYRRNLQKTLRSVLREEVMLEVRSQMADYAMLAEDEEAGPSKSVLQMTRFTPQQLPPPSSNRGTYMPRE